MKKLTALFLALAIVFSLAACGNDSQKRKSAKRIAEDALEAVQSADPETISTYWGADTFEDLEDNADNEFSAEAAEKILSGMTYKIVSSEENVADGTATVTAEITNIDMTVVLQEFLGKAFEIAFSEAFLPEDQQTPEDELNEKFTQMLADAMSDNSNNTVTTTVDIPLKLVNDEWTVEATDEVVNAMLGGINSFTDAMENAFSVDVDGESEDITAYEDEGDLGDFHVKYIESTVTKDYDGNDALIVHYEFTNNSEETTHAAAAIYVEAFQDGVQLDIPFMMDDYGGDNEWKDIRPGTTIDVYSAFELTSTSTVEIEFTEYLSFSNAMITAEYNFE